MSDTSQSRLSSTERESPAWSNKITLLALTTFVGIVLGLGGAFGTRMVGASDSTLILTAKVDQILEQNRAQDAKLSQSDASTREILLKMGNLVTREEFARFNEAAERRFQHQDQQITDLSRRVDAFQLTIQAMQQMFVDRNSKR